MPRRSSRRSNKRRSNKRRSNKTFPRKRTVSTHRRNSVARRRVRNYRGGNVGIALDFDNCGDALLTHTDFFKDWDSIKDKVLYGLERLNVDEGILGASETQWKNDRKNVGHTPILKREIDKIGATTLFSGSARQCDWEETFLLQTGGVYDSASLFPVMAEKLKMKFNDTRLEMFDFSQIDLHGLTELWYKQNFIEMRKIFDAILSSKKEKQHDFLTEDQRNYVYPQTKENPRATNAWNAVCKCLITYMCLKQLGDDGVLHFFDDSEYATAAVTSMKKALDLPIFVYDEYGFPK